MNNIQKRFLLFIFGCILSRLLLVYIAYKINKKYLPIFGSLTLIPAIGFILIYLLDLRKKGNEVFGEKIWWNYLRPIHGILYLSSVYYYWNDNIDMASICLALDIIFSLMYRFYFKK